ncbi:tetratricopeptide repeat protein [Leptolyngbya sp. DQ-M1]|uniref:tetratricopeptide repeat protein n=1 Tax=Leptolyngbya sp. DQ-M1 TaxID=2933920 RepID=UPI003296CF3E
MRMLAGYPLAIEVVLANLARQSVAQVLAGLDIGDGGLDRAGGKTESILKCVEYSHSNLSEEAQKLLLCLAPFSGFVRRDILGLYAQELQNLEPFRDYAFEQFDAAVQEAINWGLLAPMFERMPHLLSIQPIFPYFLKMKLTDQHETTREAFREGFRNHYLGLANSYHQLMKSQDAQQQQIGLFFCKLEYENLYNALRICLERQESISIFGCLDKYFESVHNTQSALLLAKEVCQAVEEYPEAWKIDRNNDQYVVALNLLAYCYLQTKQYTEAQQMYKKEIEVREVIGDRHSQAITYHQLGRVAEELHEFEQARNYYQQALQIKIEFNDRYSQASTYHQLGIFSQKLREFKQARIYYQQALQIYEEFNNRYSQASTYHQLGIVAQELRQYEEAHANYQQALQIRIEFNDRYSQASTYQNLGRLAEELREFEQARTYYQQALQIKIEFNDRYSQGSTYHSLGIIAYMMREYEQARSDYQQALRIYAEFNDGYEQAGTYHSLGTVAQELHEYEQARSDYQQALQIYEEFNARYEQASTHHNLGLLAEAEGNAVEARANYQQALERYVEFGDDYWGNIVREAIDRLSD